MNREVTLWQAMTPWAVRSLKDTQGLQLQLSAKGDTFALIKPTRHRAESVAKTVWAPRFGQAAVACFALPRELVNQLKVGSVAYEDHRDYAIPADQLATLSAFLIRPIRIVDVVTGRNIERPHVALTGVSHFPKFDESLFGKVRLPILDVGGFMADNGGLKSLAVKG